MKIIRRPPEPPKVEPVETPKVEAPKPHDLSPLVDAIVRSQREVAAAITQNRPAPIVVESKPTRFTCTVTSRDEKGRAKTFDIVVKTDEPDALDDFERGFNRAGH